MATVNDPGTSKNRDNKSSARKRNPIFWMVVFTRLPVTNLQRRNPVNSSSSLIHKWNSIAKYLVIRLQLDLLPKKGNNNPLIAMITGSNQSKG